MLKFLEAFSVMFLFLTVIFGGIVGWLYGAAIIGSTYGSAWASLYVAASLVGGISAWFATDVVRGKV